MAGAARTRQEVQQRTAAMVEGQRQVRERFSGGVGIYNDRLPTGMIGLQDVAVRSGLVGWNDRSRHLRSANCRRKTK